jgi:hypothetical protein
MKMGIKETKEIIGFILKIANAFGLSLEDGKISLGDLTNFMEPVLEASDAIANADQIPLEICDLDAEERTELLAYAKETFDIPQDDIEEIVECAFDILVQFHILIQKTKGKFGR